MILIRVDDPRLLCCILYQRHMAPCLGMGERGSCENESDHDKHGQIQQAKRPWTLRYDEWKTAGLRLLPRYPS